ncbi:hypothetical protein ACF07L_19895 [Streptomyces anulatus]|uniref:hypothetical protein n=1 Tax=Streptomyces anulatus TaxID=1892 RepID=UPI0036FA68F3
MGEDADPASADIVSRRAIASGRYVRSAVGARILSFSRSHREILNVLSGPFCPGLRALCAGEPADGDRADGSAGPSGPSPPPVTDLALVEAALPVLLAMLRDGTFQP